MTITAMLLSILELTNIFCVVLVFVGFCVMILFITSRLLKKIDERRQRNMLILRVHGDELVFPTTLHHHIQNRIPQMNMMKVHIPFTFKLLETANSSYADVKCSVSSQVKYCIYAYWGVSIQELHVCLWKSWSILRQGFCSGEFLKGHFIEFGAKISKNQHSDEMITLSLPNHQIDLGTPPRLCYPLVIFLVRTDKEGDIHPDETVALINVVHIKDSVCPLPTSILAQYLKQANGQLSCLKQLYLATGNPCGFEENNEIPLAVAEPVHGSPGKTLVCPTNGDAAATWNTSGEQLCVVCQYFPLSRALLPCRHTCICASCFDKLDRCPMCRGPIVSYFCIRGEEYMPLEPSLKPSSVHQAPPCTWLRWLDSLNDRIVDFLGYQR